MSIIGDVFGAGGISDLVQAIINKIVPDKNVQEQVRLALAQNQTAVQQMQDDYDVKLNDIAGQNIRAEEQSGDKFTERARPSVIWMGNLLIMWNYALVPVFGAHWHFSSLPIPDPFWWTWGTVVTGYVFSRGMEKISQMPGDSQVNIAGLVKIGNKS